MAIIAGLVHLLEEDMATLAIHGYSYAENKDKPIVASKGKVYTDSGYLTRAKIGDVIKSVKPLFIIDELVRLKLDDKVDERRAILINLLRLLESIPTDTPVRLYTDNGDIIKGVNAIGSKLMRANRDLWSTIYDYLTKHPIKILQYSALKDKETTDITVGRKALLARARYIARLRLTGDETHYKKVLEPEGYWTNALPRYKLPFTDLIFVTEDPDKKDDIVFSINKNQSLTSFGKKAVNCGYGVTKFRDNNPELLERVTELIAEDFDKPTFIALSLRTLYVEPGGVVSDLFKYGKRSYYIDSKKPWIAKTMTEKPLYHFDEIPHMGYDGISILNVLEDVLEEHISGNHSLIEHERDITQSFFSKKGNRVPSDRIKALKGTISLPIAHGKPTVAIVGNELPDKNTLLAMLKDKEFACYSVIFKAEGDTTYHRAWIFNTSVSYSICNNWYYSLFLF